jgi:G3E family GTPase
MLASELAESPPREVSTERGAHKHRTHQHFASLGVTLPAIVERRQLEELVRSIAPSLRRAKGVVTLAESPDRQHTWSYLGGERGLRFDVLPQTGFAPVAVFIGAGLPDADIQARIAEWSAPATPQSERR